MIMQGLQFERPLAVRLSNTWKYVCNGSILGISLCLKYKMFFFNADNYIGLCYFPSFPSYHNFHLKGNDVF